jgi:hypothetical protein
VTELPRRRLKLKLHFQVTLHIADEGFHGFIKEFLRSLRRFDVPPGVIAGPGVQIVRVELEHGVFDIVRDRNGEISANMARAIASASERSSPWRSSSVLRTKAASALSSDRARWRRSHLPDLICAWCVFRPSVSHRSYPMTVTDLDHRGKTREGLNRLRDG